ncbi:MAG TPA: DUF2188 domain-containing protein [Candidatus Absconditabacterales bacterium]|nr:DUF2188 domain-containing protein [Candidatus Absconditabacterales bacterium]
MKTNNNQQVRVSPNDGGRKVQRPGNSKASYITATKLEAIERAKKMAQTQKLEMIIQKKDGKVQLRNSYGNDPYPPKDGGVQKFVVETIKSKSAYAALKRLTNK